VSEIRIEWKWVTIAGFETPFRHMYIVYVPTDSTPQDDWLILRAGPETNNPLEFGLMSAELGVKLADSEDNYAQGETPTDRGSRVISTGTGTSELWDNLIISGMQLNLNFPYIANPNDQISETPAINSNSFIGSILYQNNIDIGNVLPIGDGPAPGARAQTHKVVSLIA